MDDKQSLIVLALLKIEISSLCAAMEARDQIQVAKKLVAVDRIFAIHPILPAKIDDWDPERGGVYFKREKSLAKMAGMAPSVALSVIRAAVFEVKASLSSESGLRAGRYIRMAHQLIGMVKMPEDIKVELPPREQTRRKPKSVPRSI